MPELSVVIPTYNTAAMTRRCVDAVRAAMPAGTEVIVVDDGSTDGTTVDGVQMIRLATNRGFAHAANCGVAASSGRIVLVLNSDAFVEANALHALLAAFTDPRLGIAGAQLVDKDGTPQWSGGATPNLVWMLAVVSGLGSMRGRRRRESAPRREVDWVSGAAMAIRREAWRPFNETYRFYCQDLELCTQARDAGWIVRVVPEARVVHAHGATIAAGSALHHAPEHLWRDLLTWGTARYGRAWGVVARIAFIVAAVFRIALHPRERAFRRALRVLVQSDA